MTNWRLRGCPRCGGDLYISKDEYDTWHEACLQCGYVSELKKVGAKPEPARADTRPVKAG